MFSFKTRIFLFTNKTLIRFFFNTFRNYVLNSTSDISIKLNKFNAFLNFHQFDDVFEYDDLYDISLNQRHYDFVINRTTFIFFENDDSILIIFANDKIIFILFDHNSNDVFEHENFILNDNDEFFHFHHSFFSNFFSTNFSISQFKFNFVVVIFSIESRQFSSFFFKRRRNCRNKQTKFFTIEFSNVSSFFFQRFRDRFKKQKKHLKFIVFFESIRFRQRFNQKFAINDDFDQSTSIIDNRQNVEFEIFFHEFFDNAFIANFSTNSKKQIVFAILKRVFHNATRLIYICDTSFLQCSSSKLMRDINHDIIFFVIEFKNIKQITKY